MFKSGFVAVVGKPNVGKSTLVNTLIGKKVSIVSPKAQTTRNNIMGVWNGEHFQVVFVDTPGIHKGGTMLDKYMQKSVEVATSDVCLVLYVIDGSKPFQNDDIHNLKSYAKKLPTFAVINKIDLTEVDKLFPELKKLDEVENLVDVFCISALNKKNLEPLKENVLKYLNDEIKYFLDDQITDKSFGFMVAETIREKMLWLLSAEVPHGVGIVIDEMTDKEKFYQVTATIFCEKSSHKTIIIGANGSKIKEIGQASRIAIEKMLGKKVNLSLWVKVKEDWRNREGVLGNIGYALEDLN